MAVQRSTRFEGSSFVTLVTIYSCTSAKAEHDLSNLSCVCMFVDQNKDPLEMVYPGIS